MISVCIPNYNYEDYLGETIQSVLDSKYPDFEIVLADNASTDSSIAVVEGFQRKVGPDKIRYKINARNVGFAGNLDEVGGMCKGDHMIMLSSDDLMMPEALPTYAKMMAEIEGRIVLSSSWDIIDSEGNKIDRDGPDPAIWKSTDLDQEWSKLLGYPVYKVAADELLKRCLLKVSTPFHFCTTCYRRADYLSVDGYGKGRLINPDKWFHWKLLTEVEFAYYLDSSLFSYRWHANNQTAQQHNSGHLKYLLDEYRGVIEIPDSMLDVAGLSRDQFHHSFIQNDILKHGLGELSRGLWRKANRVFHFGKATFPALMRQSKLSYVLRGLIMLGPVGVFFARVLRKMRAK